jgi:amino acid adenylation domain-containing protein
MELWDAAVAAFGGRPALSDDRRSLTYRELDRSTDSIAAALRRGGIGPERTVGLQLQRPLDFVLGAIAAWKAGGAFAITSAASRQVAVDVALYRQGDGDGPADGAPALELGQAERCASARPPDGLISPHQLAYLLSTSGSTSAAKTAMLERRNLAAFVAAVTRRLGLDARDRWFQLASPSFDVFVEEVFPILATGGAVLCRASLAVPSFPALQDQLARGGATIVELTTLYWREYHRFLVATGSRPPAALRLLIVGGERMDAPAYRDWQSRFPDVALVHVYGITETTVSSTMFEGSVTAHELDVPVGDRLDHSDVQLAGDEIYLGGACVGRGYLGRPARTAERFVPDPRGAPGSRRYVTGDVGRIDEHGQLVFLGRRDDEIKVRGHRVQLSDIEVALRAIPGVHQATVIPDAEIASNLVGFIVRAAPLAAPRPGARPRCRLLAGRERAAICDPLRAAVAAWAVPGRLFEVDEFPRTRHGKLDHAEIARWSRSTAEGEPGEDGGALGDVVLATFRRALAAPSFGPDDNFFDHGGDSLTALVIVSELGERFSRSLCVGTILDAPTPRALAGRLADRDESSCG